MNLRKYAKAFLVAFFVAAMFDACAKYFNLFLTQLQSINKSVGGVTDYEHALLSQAMFRKHQD